MRSLALQTLVRTFPTCLLLLIAPSVARCDWPTYLHDHQRTGYTDEPLSAPLQKVWEYSAPAAPEMAWSGPRSELFEGLQMRHRVAFDNVLHTTSAGTLVYFASSVDHKVYCLDGRSGKVVWQFFTGGPVRLAPTLADGKVYFGSDDGFVYCLDGRTGKQLWSLRAGPNDEQLLARGHMISRWPVRTGVVVLDGTAYFGAGVLPHETVFLYAVNAQNGAIVWRNDTISQQDAGRNPLSPQGYLLAEGSRLFVPSGRSLPAAFDRQDGHELYQRSHSWRTTAGGIVGGTKAVLADGQIYASGPDHFLALNQASGAVGFAWVTGRQLVISSDKAFVADGKRIVCIDRLKHAKATIERQKLRLQLRDVNSKRSQMSADEFKSKAAPLAKRIAELSDVGVLWEAPVELADSLIGAGRLLIAGGSGQVIALQVDDGKQIWKADVDGTAGGLSAGDGRLLVSTTTGKVYGFGTADGAASSPHRVQVNSPADDSPYPDDDWTATYGEVAQEIIERTGVRRGYCLVVGSEQGRLAYELARRTDLHIYGIEPDAEKAESSRLALDKVGLHGTRITIVQGDLNEMPFSNYFANLVVSDRLVRTGHLDCDPDQIALRVKPVGGVVYLTAGQRSSLPAADARALLGDLLQAINLPLGGELNRWPNAVSITRGMLPGSGRWTHQYGDAANTMTSSDERVRGDLGVLWYGDPGPTKMINRHDAAAAPLSANGRMFIQGVDSVMAYDAYNGLFLWEYKDPGAVRTGVFNNEDTSNMAASDDHLFIVVDDTCTALDAATGKVSAEFKVPPSSDGVKRIWGYVANWNGMLFGTSTVRKELDRSQRRRGLRIGKATDAIFAIDLKTGKRLWTYRGKNILHVTIAIGDGGVYFIDSSITGDEREALLRQDKTDLKKLGPDAARKKEAELKSLDVRLAVALDASTGKVRWSQPVDVTDCSRVGIGGGNLTLMYQDGHVLICGANANGHYWRQFLSGQFQRRRLVVLDSRTGKKLWAKDANYRHRPIIVGSEIFAEPWAFELHTGEPKMREHPVTGELTEWQFSRPGHHCGPVTAAQNMLFFRSGFTGYYDLYNDSGTSHFAGQRLGCWVNAIPGNGLLMVPEASAGCVCQFSLAATIVMEPRTDHPTWRIYSAGGVSLPVKHLAINLGAPGDRRDAQGQLWFAYPRPHTVGRLEYVFQLGTKLAPGGGYYAENDQRIDVSGSEVPWVCASGARGLERCEIPLLGKDDPATRYTVELHFAELKDLEPGERVCDIKLQGKVVARQFDILAEARQSKTEVLKRFENIDVKDKLTLELIRHGAKLPVLSGIAVRRQDRNGS